MNDCLQIRALLPLGAGLDLDPPALARINVHLAACPDCERRYGQFLLVIQTARAIYPVEHHLPDEIRNRIAVEAAARVVTPSLFDRLASWYVLIPARGLAAAAAAALVASLFLPLALRSGAGRGHEEGVTSLEVVQSGDGVTLAWSDGSKGSYTVYKGSDPRHLTAGEAHVVKGNVWTDAHPDSAPVIYYRIE